MQSQAEVVGRRVERHERAWEDEALVARILVEEGQVDSLERLNRQCSQRLCKFCLSSQNLLQDMKRSLGFSMEFFKKIR